MAGAEEVNLRKYLLGQLTEAEEERIEIRLLSDSDFAEEFDIVVDEITDDYVAGKFAGDEREQVERYFFKAPGRRHKLKFALALRARKSEIGADKGKKHKFMPYLAIAASVLLAAGGFYVWRTQSNNSDLNKGLAALQSAYREQRPIEARISKFDYAPYSTTRGPGTDKVDQDELQLAELTLRQALKSNPTPALHHGLGKVLLAKKQFDDAVKEFDEGLKGDPNNAQLYSDLGAAWLEKGKMDRSGSQAGVALEELARSLDQFNKALDLKPDLLEALFNRAICRTYMGPPKQAEDDWRQYIEKDSTSPWSEEARRNLSLLEERNTPAVSKVELLNEFLDAYKTGNDHRAWQLISMSRDDLSGTSILQQLMDAYLNRITSGNEAELEIRQLSYVGGLAIENANEYYDSAVVATMRSLAPKHVTTLLKARSLMKTGYGMYAQSRLSEAVKVFEMASKAFAQSGDDVEVNHARFWTAYCYLEGLDTQRGLAILTVLTRHCEQQNYRWLLMKALQNIASAKYNRKEYSTAIDYATRALDVAEQLGDSIGQFDALDTLTELYRAINNYLQALNSIARSQSLVNCCAFNPIKLWRHYAIVAFAFHSAGLHAAALDCQQEVVRRAIETGETSMICVSYAHLGLMYGQARNYEQGLRSTQLAYGIASAHTAENLGKEMMAYASLQTGHLYRNSAQCEKAIEQYDKAIALYESLQVPVQLYQAHKGRLACYIGEDNKSLASAELEGMLILVERNRSTIFEGDNRNRFFDVEQSVYDMGIAFAYEKLGDEKRAFDYSEDSRARSLLDLMPRSKTIHGHNHSAPVPVSQPLKWFQIKEQVPENCQIIEYAVLPSRTIIWVINNRGVVAKQTQITQAGLEEHVRSYVESIADPNRPDTALLGRELFDLLIKPLEDLLDKTKQLAIVPDKSLNELPFGALVSGANKYLVEDYCITYSPSATIFILKSTQARRMDMAAPEKLLSVGNPSFDARMYPSLPDMPAG